VLRVTTRMDTPDATIAPEPDDAVRAAILEALAEADEPEPAWAVSARAPASFEQHDVCSLW
jgi:hypothetical protein